jgi:hypothetical protein
LKKKGLEYKHIGKDVKIKKSKRKRKRR